MKKKGTSGVSWLLIFLIFVLIILAFLYMAYYFENEQIQNESNTAEEVFVDEQSNESNGTINVVSDVGGMFRTLKDFFSQ
jgi:archaellum component FlaF (FlaF/FlaG flagellin family)